MNGPAVVLRASRMQARDLASAVAGASTPMRAAVTAILAADHARGDAAARARGTRRPATGMADA